MENKDHLLEVLKTLFRWKKHIIITCVTVALGACITVLLLPIYYESMTIFYPASQDLAMPANIFGTPGSKMEYYGTDEDADRILSIAESGELANYLIEEFDLYEVYDIDTADVKAPYFVMETFEELYNVKRTKENSIEITVEDEDPTRAAAMVNAAREKINEIGQRLVKESQAMTIQTFEEGFKDREMLLAGLNDSLQLLRERYGIFNVVTQGEEMANMIARRESRLTSDSARLELYSKLSGTRDSVRNIKARIAGTNKELESLITRLHTYNEGLSIVSMLQEEHEEASKQLGEDRERYKQFKSAYDTQFPTTLLLERGSVPVIKSRPHRTLIVVGSVIAAFLLSVIGVLIFDTYQHVNWKEVIEGK